MKYDIFISYSREDLDFALKVSDMLNRYACYYEFNYFFDRDAIKCSNEYLKRISMAIADSRSMLFLASGNSYRSEFCCKELLFADKRHVRIHQYRIDKSEIPSDIELLLGTHQYREASLVSIEDIIREVLSSVLCCDITSISVLEEQKRRIEEVEKAERAAERKRLRENIANLERRSREIDDEILLCEKNLAGLNTEREFVEKGLENLRKILSGTYSQPIPTSSVPAVKHNSKTYKVGDYYNENGKLGVVFEVLDGGQHGKIISLDETKVAWDSRLEKPYVANGCVVGAHTYANSKSDGEANTRQIMSRIDCHYFPTFMWCRAKSTDWYLPAIDELKKIYNNIAKINSTLSQYCATPISRSLYWSSTEERYSPRLYAWYVNINDGLTVDYDKKGNSHFVRAVSTF